MINAIFSQFVEATPITVMVRGIMERIFEPTALDELFESHAVKQYTRELLFSNVVSLMSLVVSGIHPSVSGAYKALEKDLGVSRPALYGKLNGMELGVSQALVRYSASNLESIIDELKVNPTQLSSCAKLISWLRLGKGRGEKGKSQVKCVINFV